MHSFPDTRYHSTQTTTSLWINGRVWQGRLHWWSLPTCNWSRKEQLEWILRNWIRASKFSFSPKRMNYHISCRAHHFSFSGTVQCDAARIWRQGRQSSRSGFSRRRTDGLSKVRMLQFPCAQGSSGKSVADRTATTYSQPIYGLIFLFRWREDDSDKQEASCPEGLWFANQVRVICSFLEKWWMIFFFFWIQADYRQTASNACASVALLNIVNNIPEIDLGGNLQHFKEFTMPFTPALRGDAISNFEFIKKIHNSFARWASCCVPRPSPNIFMADPSRNT